MKQHRETLAAVIVEPLVQGAAGMLMMPEGYLARLRAVTRECHVLLLCDEVATGFGRTGTMFACEQEGVSPDIMAVAKGLTGGYLPLAATLTTKEVYDAFLGRYEEFKAFFHGHSYTANPLGCAAALATLSIFAKEDVLKQVSLLSEENGGGACPSAGTPPHRRYSAKGLDGRCRNRSPSGDERTF